MQVAAGGKSKKIEAPADIKPRYMSMGSWRQKGGKYRPRTGRR